MLYIYRETLYIDNFVFIMNKLFIVKMHAGAINPFNKEFISLFSTNRF